MGKGKRWTLPLSVSTTICQGLVSYRYGAPFAEQSVRRGAVNLAFVVGFWYLQLIKKDNAQANRDPARGWLVQRGRGRTPLGGTELTCVARPGHVVKTL